MLYLSKSTNTKREIQVIYKHPKFSEGDDTGFSPPPPPSPPSPLEISPYYVGVFRQYRTRSPYSEGPPLTFYRNASLNM